MNDNSPVLLRIKESSQPFHFFIFTISIFRAALSIETFKQKLEHFEADQTLLLPPLLDSITDTANKLLSAPEDSQETIELSVVNVSALLSAVDMISKELLADDANLILDEVKTSMPYIEADWEVNYLKSAQILFEQLKDKLGDRLRNFDILLKFVTRHQV